MRCILNRQYIPLFPCSRIECEWYIHDQGYNNCFWVLSRILDKSGGLEFDEISKLENIPIAEVIKIYEDALAKCRQDSNIHKIFKSKS